jgi:putative peptidoglycan lipid II flippase
MIRGFKQIAGLTLISRILGMLRDMVFAYFFGADWLMTAFAMGFQVPNLARRLFGEGAASASVIPIYSDELQKDPAAANHLACSVITAITAILSVLVVLGEIAIGVYILSAELNEGTRMGLLLTAIMLPFAVFICDTAVLGGILNVHRHFWAPAAAPVAWNLIIIAFSYLAAVILKLPPEQQVYVVAAGEVVAGVVQLWMQIGPLRKHGVILRPVWDFHSPAFKRVLLLMGPMVLGATVTQINTLADNLIALAFSNDQGRPLTWGSVSYLYYAQRLYQFPLGVLGISLATAIFPELSTEAARGAFSRMMQVVSRGMRMSIFVAVPATVGLILVARPLIAVLFEHGRFTSEDTRQTAWTMSFYTLGLCGFFIQQILVRAFYSTKDSKIPALTAAGAVVINVILNLTLIWPLGTGGLALSTAICSYLQVIVLMIVLKKKHPAEMMEGLWKTIIKTGCAAAVMAGAGIGVLKLMADMPISLKYDLIRTGALVIVCAGVYIGVSAVLKNEMFALLMGRKKRKTEIIEN